MFTGIVEEIGTVRQVVRGTRSSHFVIAADKVLNDTKIADVMAETMRRSKLGSLSQGSRVNLERALSLQTRLGGHIVSGHIDGTGTITRMEREDNAVWVTVTAEPTVLKYIIEKGSITIDGISLTVAYVDDTCFRVSIIPHTAEETTLLTQKAGDTVNLECDMLGKYVERLLHFEQTTEEQTSKTAITSSYLAEHGFL